jgi:PAS domain S-box-containing protein
VGVLLLGLTLLALLWVYWAALLQPRLHAEAVSQAEILAQSQGKLIAQALRAGSGQQRVRGVVHTLDQLLLLRDPNTKTPFFDSIELQVDYDAVGAEEGSLDLHRGTAAPGGFPSEVAIYDPDTDELLAVANVEVSGRFFQSLSRDLRRGLWGVVLAGLLLLGVVWGVLLALLAKLERQRLRREAAERELSQQEQKYQRLLDNLSTYFVYGKDADGRLAFVSESVRQVLGFSPAELRERYPGGLPAPAGGEGSPTGSFPTTPSGIGLAGERVYEAEVADAHGDLHHIELSELRVVDDAGRTAGVDGIARDVTAQRQAQEELRHAKEQAEAANRAKSQFLANMSHEIRTPLNAIVGLTGLALKVEVPPRVGDFLGKIRASAHLLTEIIEDILDLSRIEAGRLEIQRIDFDLDEMLAELADVVGMRVGSKSLEILFAAAADVPRRLRGDPVRLKQVLLNLLGNALKFTSSGEIVIEIGVVEVRRERAELRFAVRDTGIGIPAEHLPTLFDPFTQVDASMTRRFGGAGLGLAISRRLVRMMGGELQVESAQDRGSTFSFTAAFELPRGPSGPRRLADEFRDLPVLVVDDNASARAVLGSMLRSLSCRVTTAASGEEALAAAERASREGNPFRLAVLDWKMPGLDGAETARLLAAQAQSPPAERPPAAILVTAYDREDAARRAEQVGIEVVLHKPVSPSTLHDALLQVLDPERPRAPAAPVEVEARFGPGQRVLLVEDNPINREVARELLRLAGLAVEEAHNGLQALQCLEEGRFDAVMMDVQMPELDGIDTVRLLRAQPDLAGLPVIAMTAHAMLGDRERFLEAGMSDYLAKPIAERELMRVLGRWLRQAEPADGQPTSRPAPSPASRDGAACRDAASAGTSELPCQLPADLPGLAVGDGLRRAGGNAPLYRRLLGLFRDENARTAPWLAELLAAGRREEALALLHTLEGTAATIGAGPTAAAAAALEGELRAGAAAEALAPRQARLAETLDELLASIAEAGRDVEPIGVVTSEAAAGPQEGLAGTSGVSESPAPPSAAILLGQLAELLPKNDLRALDCFAELERALLGRQAPALSTLAGALDRLDFEGALVEVRRLAAELAAPAEGP